MLQVLPVDTVVESHGGSSLKFVAFILAGGTGTRFWPLSRRNFPKQLISIGDHPVMIQDTVDRLLEFLDPENVFVITAREHAGPVRNQLHVLPHDNIVVEPEGRDTAACAGLTGIITRRSFDGETVVGFFPADHRITERDVFQEAVENAVTDCRETGGTVTFGIEPDRPATGYGYIIPDRSTRRDDGLMKVNRFTEKPDRNQAQSFIEEDGALWNSGMFFWSANRILADVENFLPELFEGLLTIETEWEQSENLNQALENHYSQLPATSVDYGIIEQSNHVWTLPVNFDWNDLGTWDSVTSIIDPDPDENRIDGDVLPIDVEDSILVNRGGPFIGAIGLENVVIVSTEDAILVCDKKRTEDVKKLVTSLESSGREELL